MEQFSYKGEYNGVCEHTRIKALKRTGLGYRQMA